MPGASGSAAGWSEEFPEICSAVASQSRILHVIEITSGDVLPVLQHNSDLLRRSMSPSRRPADRLDRLLGTAVGMVFLCSHRFLSLGWRSRLGNTPMAPSFGSSRGRHGSSSFFSLDYMSHVACDAVKFDGRGFLVVTFGFTSPGQSRHPDREEVVRFVLGHDRASQLARAPK